MLLKMINKDFKIIISVGILMTAIMTSICAFINLTCTVLCFVLGALLCGLFSLVTVKRLKKISSLNDYLSLVCSGQYDLDISENSEGELSILKNNLYKVIIILRTQNDLLKKDKTYLADALADISHQLKTPLTSMMVMTDLLKENISDEKKDEFLTVMETQLDKMKWLISTLLKLSKLDAGTADFKSEEFSISSALEEVLNPFMITLDLKGINLDYSSDDCIVKGDKSWTVQAIQNIVKNCIEHTDKNGIISIKVRDNNIVTTLIVQDSGCGIAKEDLPHIFERFYHGKNASKESVGIGLAFAKAVLEKENASITVQSDEGKGTTFEIKFYKAII